MKLNLITKAFKFSKHHYNHDAASNLAVSGISPSPSQPAEDPLYSNKTILFMSNFSLHLWD